MVADAGLLRAMRRVIASYEEQENDTAAGRVLVHGDLGLHNIAITPDTGEVAGVFDYDSAAWADRHQDFRYLVFPGSAGSKVLNGVLDACEPAAGLQLDRDRICLCNAACAIGFLAFRDGAPPEAHSCGRTLDEDLHWTTQALHGLRGF